jgi:hypothetical protein
MRMLLRVSIPVETGNAAAKAGTLVLPSRKYWPTLNRKQPISFPMITVNGLALSCST